jgi:signal transduction histidine kinase
MAAAAVVPLLAYGAVSIYSLRSGAQQTVITGNRNVARRAAEQIEQYVSGSVRILQAVGAEMQHTGLKQWQQERILKNYALEFPEFTELTLTDENGQTIVTSRLGASNLAIPGSDSIKIYDDVLMSSFSVDVDALPTAILAIPLVEGGNSRWLVARFSLEELWRMVDKIRVGQHGFALVIAGQGQLVAHGEPESKSLVVGFKTVSHPLMAAPKNGTGVTAESSPDSLEYFDWATERNGARRRGTILGVKADVAPLGWTVVVEQPTAEAFEVPNRLQRQLFVAIALALFAMLSVGYFWGRSFLDPILRLTRGTKALAEGRLDERVVIHSTDELGQLGTAFNNMADRLVELQEDVRKKERLAVFGRVTIGLVHDLSNPLQNIGNACKMIIMMFDDIEYRQTFKRTVERELAQVKRMLDDLRNVAKPMPLERFPIDVNKAMREVAESMQASAEKSGLTLETALCFGPLYIQGDLYALNRVYQNLITNAFQATTPQGSVVIKTIRQDDHAVIEITDTGSGIPQDRLATIFDDFVTTKKRGLGLGLAMAKRVVEQLGGTIAATSEVGRGTTFTIRFPLTKARPEQLAVS